MTPGALNFSATVRPEEKTLGLKALKPTAQGGVLSHGQGSTDDHEVLQNFAEKQRILSHAESGLRVADVEEGFTKMNPVCLGTF